MEEALKLDERCYLMMEAGKHFACKDETTGRGMLLYHHYQNRRKLHGPRNEESDIVAIAAFNLCTEMCKENITLEQAIEFFEQFLHCWKKEPGDMEWLKKVIIRVQSEMHILVCSRCGSAFIYETAHSFVLKYMEQFSNLPEIAKEDLRSVEKLSLKFINAFYNCRKCLTYTRLEIAWAALHVALEQINIDINQIDVLKKELSKSVKAERHQNAKHDLYQVLIQSARLNAVSDRQFH